MDRSLGFGSTPSDCRPIRTRFLYAFPIRLSLPLNTALPNSLATTIGISVDVFSSGYLDVSVLQVRFDNLCIQLPIPIARWVPPFRNLRIKVYLPTPRSLSQAITSFVAYHRQGIHHMLLVT
ncbi:unnamed protein product [Allacma fusca]|uniref:Uncharacterized protein n=1 Tax=Allacma fusca TaxID=39272 RepID=A0A8J2JMX3_9HEXA|nr:unnamed protein product [Allacma fusca]